MLSSGVEWSYMEPDMKSKVLGLASLFSVSCRKKAVVAYSEMVVDRKELTWQNCKWLFAVRQ